MVIGPRHNNLTCFKRLAERIKRRLGEFGKFVEEQHAAMRQ